MKIIKDKTRILLTGSNGFLGSHVYDELLKRTYNKEIIFTPKRIDFDLTKESDVINMFNSYKPDIVIHLAADIGGIGYSKNHPASQLYNNLMMNTLVHHYSHINRVTKFVGIGTVCSYPKFASIPFKEEELWNGYPEETNAAYGLSKKMMMEQTIAYNKQYNFNAIHLLMINLYGPRDNFDLTTSHVIPAIIRKVDFAIKNNMNEISLWGDGTPTREFIYVSDAARSIILAMEEYDKPFPVNIGTGIDISIKDLAIKISKLMKYKGKIKFDPSKPNGQPKRRLDVSKAKNNFNFEASMNLELGLIHTIEWYLNQFSKS
jgi:GDP-L-fucose synthase